MQSLAIIAVLIPACLIPAACGYLDAPYVWNPPRIVTGESYEGIVILDAASTSGQLVALSTSDPSVIRIPESVFISAYSNHGIFQITPLREGDSQIFALVDGKVISSSVSVYSSNRQPERLMIVLPSNTTKAEELVGYIISTDANGIPAATQEDVLVTLSATEMISLEKTKIKIPAGEYNAKFYANIGGSGKIYATAKNLSIAEQHITKVLDNITVRIAVAPNIMLENSKAFFFVWLEKDGKPYKVPYVTYAYISSSNVKSVRFNENPHISHHSDTLFRVPLVDGVGRGHLISQEPGASVVTASVDKFGLGKTEVFVGPVTTEQDVNSSKILARHTVSDVAMAWFYPSVTYSRAYGVVALYHIDRAGGQSSNTIIPVAIDGRAVTLSSSGVSLPNILTLSESKVLSGGMGSTHATQFEVTGTIQGNHTIFVSGPGLDQYNATLSVSPPFRDLYSIKVTQIPAVLGTRGDLAMISIVDDSSSLVNAKKAVGSTRFSLSSSDGHTEFSIPVQNAAVYSGVMEENAKIAVFADGFAPLETVLRPSGAAASVTLDVPPLVHKAESFPYTVHEVDSGNTPIRRLTSASTSATPGVTVGQGRMLIGDVGIENIGIVTRIGADSQSVESFANTFRVEIIPSGITNKLEKQFGIDLVGDIEDFATLIDSPFPYEKLNEKSFLITPDKVGSYNITVIATKNGYTPAKDTIPLTVEKFVDITIRTITNDGADLNVEQQIHLGNTSRNVITPFHEEVRPQFFHAVFPPDVLLGGRGYKLSNITFADQTITDNRIERIFLGKNIEITANYDRTVKVQVENAYGSGFYTFGKQVTLSAPPKDKVWFLVRDVFDRWEGLEYNSDHVTFVATNDINAKAVLREDYTFLMLIMATAISAVLYANFVRRKGLDIRFYLNRQSVRDFILMMTRGKAKQHTV